MRRTILGLMAAALLILGQATSASAETGSKNDPSHDAAARIDLTKFTVKNGDHRVNFRVKVRDLRERGVFSFYYWGGTTGQPPPRSAIVLVRLVDGETRTKFYVCNQDECPREPCPGMRTSWRTEDNVVKVSLPQRCYPRPASNPDAPAPAVGRFFAYGSMDAISDEIDGAPLTLDRG